MHMAFQRSDLSCEPWWSFDGIYSSLQKFHGQLKFGSGIVKKDIQIETHILPPDHPLLDGGPNLGPLISRWEIN
jgi:hypothetical protein